MGQKSGRKVSATGYIIAAAMAKILRVTSYKKYFSEDAIYLNESFAKYANDSALKHCLALLPLRLALWLMDSFFVPGLMYHYIFRKLYIEDQAVVALRHGVEQVINLGAGFDTLALRMAKHYPQVRFVEVDLPQTQAVKSKILKRIAFLLPSNLSFVPADLSEKSVGEALAGALDPKKPTLIILEGVLMYLVEAEIKNLFLELQKLFSGRLTIVFGALATASNSKSQAFIKRLLAKGNEEYKWHCQSNQIGSFMSKLGYELKQCIRYKDMQRLYRSENELLKVPEEDENYYLVEKQQESRLPSEGV